MIKGVLFDRDGTIVIDVPYNGDPALVQPGPDARLVLDRLRSRGIRVGVLTNQSGVGRGIITEAMMKEVNREIERLLGPFDGWFICPHAPDDGCDCRKPKPKLVLDAACEWGVHASEIAVIGDNESDVEAARNAGAIGLRIESGARLSEIINSLLK